jgi:hypothetical protein
VPEARRRVACAVRPCTNLILMKTAKPCRNNPERDGRYRVPIGPTPDPTALGDGLDCEFNPIEPNAMGLAFDDFVIAPFRCVNCSVRVDGVELYCRKSCSSEADFVRYVRRNRANGGLVDPGIVRAIKLRLIRKVESGYNRKLPRHVREAVIATDGVSARRVADQVS